MSQVGENCVFLGRLLGKTVAAIQVGGGWGVYMILTDWWQDRMEDRGGVSTPGPTSGNIYGQDGFHQWHDNNDNIIRL